MEHEKASNVEAGKLEEEISDSQSAHVRVVQDNPK